MKLGDSKVKIQWLYAAQDLDPADQIKYGLETNELPMCSQEERRQDVDNETLAGVVPVAEAAQWKGASFTTTAQR